MTGYRVSDGGREGVCMYVCARLCLVRDIEIGVTGCLMVFLLVVFVYNLSSNYSLVLLIFGLWSIFSTGLPVAMILF